MRAVRWTQGPFVELLVVGMIGTMVSWWVATGVVVGGAMAHGIYVAARNWQRALVLTVVAAEAVVGFTAGWTIATTAVRWMLPTYPVARAQL